MQDEIYVLKYDQIYTYYKKHLHLSMLLWWLRE